MGLAAPGEHDDDRQRHHRGVKRGTAAGLEPADAAVVLPDGLGREAQQSQRAPAERVAEENDQ